MRTVLTLSVFALALAGCGSDPEIEPGEDGTRAEGEVLGGTIDDEMLPLDTVRSQSPPLDGSGEAGDPGDATSAPPGAEASTGPAVEPAEDAEPIAEDGA